MFSIPITWRWNATTIDMIEIMTSPHPMLINNLCTVTHKTTASRSISLSSVYHYIVQVFFHVVWLWVVLSFPSRHQCCDLIDSVHTSAKCLQKHFTNSQIIRSNISFFSTLYIHYNAFGNECYLFSVFHADLKWFYVYSNDFQFDRHTLLASSRSCRTGLSIIVAKNRLFFICSRSWEQELWLTNDYLCRSIERTQPEQRPHPTHWSILGIPEWLVPCYLNSLKTVQRYHELIPSRKLITFLQLSLLAPNAEALIGEQIFFVWIWSSHYFNDW